MYDGRRGTRRKGESKFGIVAYAERLNGRAAVVGFTALFLIELVSGKGLIELLGLQYDEGAQMAIADGGIVGLSSRGWRASSCSAPPLSARLRDHEARRGRRQEAERRESVA